MPTTTAKYTKKKWHELTADQQAELIRQMEVHKVPADEQLSLIYLIRPDGSVYGYQFVV